MSELQEVVVKWLGHYYNRIALSRDKLTTEEADSLLALLSQHGVVQIIKPSDSTIHTAQIHSVRPITEGE